MKQEIHQKRWLLFWALFLAAVLSITVTFASSVNLIAYVTYSLLDVNGNPLPDGSIVMIFGSSDAVNDGPASYGTNLMANSTQNDDVYLGFVVIGQPSFLGSNGTFYTANEITFDDSIVNWLYLRFFDTAEYPVQGYTNWGVSDLYGYTNNFGFAEVDFVGNYTASLTNNFVVIPEPGTAHLFLLFVVLVAGMHASVVKQKRNTGSTALLNGNG